MIRDYLDTCEDCGQNRAERPCGCAEEHDLDKAKYDALAGKRLRAGGVTVDMLKDRHLRFGAIELPDGPGNVYLERPIENLE